MSAITVHVVSSGESNHRLFTQLNDLGLNYATVLAPEGQGESGSAPGDVYPRIELQDPGTGEVAVSWAGPKYVEGVKVLRELVGQVLDADEDELPGWGKLVDHFIDDQHSSWLGSHLLGLYEKAHPDDPIAVRDAAHSLLVNLINDVDGEYEYSDLSETLYQFGFVDDPEQGVQFTELLSAPYEHRVTTQVEQRVAATPFALTAGSNAAAGPLL